MDCSELFSGVAVLLHVWAELGALASCGSLRPRAHSSSRVCSLCRPFGQALRPLLDSIQIQPPGGSTVGRPNGQS